MKRTISFAIFLLCAFTSYPHSASAEFLLDTDGDPVKNGGSYYMVSVMRPGGGLTTSQTKNEFCPITVMKEMSEGGRGLPVQFSSQKKIRYLSKGDYLTVRFYLVPWCAPTPSQWTVLEGSRQVKLTGYNKTVSGDFRVESAHDDFYTLSFCPSPINDNTCKPVGGPSFGGSGNLVVGDEAQKMEFMFQKFRGNLGGEAQAIKYHLNEK